MYSKFSKIMTTLNNKENARDSQTLAEIMWLIFILAKNKLLEDSLDIMNNTCMLANTIIFVLRFSWKYQQPGFFTKDGKLNKNSHNDVVHKCITENILDFFHIKQMDVFKNIATRFEEYFNHLYQTKVLKTTDVAPYNFFSH